MSDHISIVKRKPHPSNANPGPNKQESNLVNITDMLHSTKIHRGGAGQGTITAQSSGTTTPMPEETSSYSRPMRPDFGKEGRVIPLTVNMFQVKFNPKLTIFHYDVSLKEESGGKKVPMPVKRLIFQAWVKTLASSSSAVSNIAKTCVYDGQKNLFSPKDLGIGTKSATYTVTITEDGDKPREFTIVLKEAAQLDLSVLDNYLSNNHRPGLSVFDIDYPRDKISALEVLIRHVPALNFLAFGRGSGSFFKPQVGQPLRGGLEARGGWIQSLRPALGELHSNYVPGGPVYSYKQLLLNMDTVTTSFYEAGPLDAVLSKFFGVSNMDECRRFIDYPDKRDDLIRYLRMLKIEIKYRKEGRRMFTIQGISRQGASDIVKEIDGRKLSIAAFFKQTYNISLKYPWLPCIECGPKRDILIPMELCYVKPNQRHIGKLGDLQVADLIKITAVPPHIRQQNISAGFKQLHDNHDSQFLKEWGVSINPDMVKCDGRILPPPTMTFRNNKPFKSNDGTWKYGQGTQFANPASLNSWGVIVFGAPNQIQSRDVERFFNGLMDTLRELGMQVKSSQNLSNTLIYSERNERPEATVERADRKFGKVDIVFCVLGYGGSSIYNDIKRAAETKAGMMTQCIQSKHVRDDPNRKKPYFANLALKVNVKLGGVNTVMSATELPAINNERIPTMLIGADVTHPAPGEVGKSSIAAVVGSIDKRYCEYRTIIRAQPGRVEIIQELDQIVKELFMLFRAQNGIYPKRVIFYRDGVSEGQFGEVVYSEVSSMKKMFAQLCGPADMPKVTFVVMSKRHHVRFFATNRNDADNKGNLKAGTVIDRTVTHPFEFDFFLYSHAGLQGTSRPAHYHVLYDENAFTSDSLQAWTYRLCYLFCRSMRTVSMVPPAYYAHLAAARARCYIDAGRPGKGPAPKLIADVVPEIQRTMFFV